MRCQSMKINKKFTKAARRMLSVAVCLVMMFTTFFIFDPAVLSELFPKASAWNFTTYATSTSGNKAGLTINTTAKTAIVNTSDGFAYFLSHMTSEFQGYTVTLNTDVYMQPSMGATSVNYDYNDSDTTAWYGVLDGNGHCVSNYRYFFKDSRNNDIRFIGLIRKMCGGEVKNLTLLNSFVYCANTGTGKKQKKEMIATGVLIGGISNDSNSLASEVKITNVTIDNAYVNGYSYGGDASRSRDVGGFAGNVGNKVTFTDCKITNSKIQPGRSDSNYDGYNQNAGAFVGWTNSSITITNTTQAVSVSNTTVYRDGTGDAGHAMLIGNSEGENSTIIKNVITEGTVYGSWYTGGMVGNTWGSFTAENCINRAKVVGNGDNVGGLVGRVGDKKDHASYNSSVSMKNCTNEGSVSNNGKTTAGGLIGWLNNSTYATEISYCTNKGSVTSGKDYAGGIIGADDGTGFGTVSNAHNFGVITGGRYAGGIVGRTTRQMKLLNCVNESGATITTTTDNKKEPDTCAGGIIGKNEGARQVIIENCTNNGSVKASRDYAGGIMGYLDASNSGATFKNCVNNGSVKNGVSTGAYYAGGILAASGNNNPVTFENCRNNVDVGNAMNYTGGITGYVKGRLTMKNSVNIGNVSGAQFTAGLCAWIQDDGCEITNCLNTGTVSTNGKSNGAGILSTVDSQANNPTWKITNCVNTGDIKNGVSAIGGILGYMGNLDNPGTVIISDCINKGNIDVTGNDVGGIVGNLFNHGSSTQHHKYTNCYNYGNISSSSANTDDEGVLIGGIVGKEYGYAEFSGCRNYGEVKSSNSTADSISGGICGWIQDDPSSFTNNINYGTITAGNNVGGILGEIKGSTTGAVFKFTQCGNYGNLSTKKSDYADIGGIVGKITCSNSDEKIYMSKCFNGNGKDGRIASVSYKAKNAGGLFGEINRGAVIADSYNNASSISSSTNAGGLIGTNNGNTTLAYNSFSVTESVSKLEGSGKDSGDISTTGCFTKTMGKGTAALAVLNTTRPVPGISSVGNAYDYKQGVNYDYPALKWQLNTLTKNVGRNLLADLIADTAKSGYSAQGSSYSIKLDGITKTYYPTYTKTVNGITVTYDTMSDLFTLSGTPTATGSFNILSVSNPEAKSAFASAYYVGGNAMGCSTTVFSTTIGRTGKVHALKSVSAGETVNVSVYVTPNVPVQFDNYKFHASMDYALNIITSSDTNVDLHSTYSGLGTPTKTGYKFLGWYTQRSSGSRIADGSTVANFGIPKFDDTLDRDVDIYAHWDPITYTIIYNGNGATSGSTTSSSHTYDEEKNLTANGFYRKFDVNLDYCNGRETETLTATSSFLGWATSPDGEPIYSNGQSVKNLTTEDGKIIDLYAKWAADSSVELPTPTMTGYTFDGWYTSDGTKVSQTFTPTAATNLTAHWTPITYTVSYNGNGGSGTTASSTHTYDVAQKLTKNGFERKFTVTFNYNDGRTETRTVNAVSTFTGWICSKDGKTYADGAEVKNLTDKSETITMTAQWTDASVDIPTPARSGYKFSGWTDQEGNQVSGRITPTKDITLTANWDAIVYTVLYDGNGGSGSTASSTHTYDVAQNLTKNGFERKFTVTFNYNDGVTSNTVSTVKSDFNGWICSKDEKTYADEAEVKNLTDKSEEITMTAQWTDKTVTVPETERENYIFLGWFDAQGNEYKGTFTPTSDLVITAKWQEKAKYTVTFKNGDEILQQSEWYVDTMPTFNGTEPTKESDNRYEYTFSGWSPEITKVTGETTYEAQFTATEHHFKSVKVDGETHRSECACGYKLESTKHNIELKDGKYTCKDCGYVVPDFTAVTADGATLTKTLRADMTTKYLVATVSYPNASKPNKEGKYFVYWYDRASSEIVSAFTTYSFFLTKEVDIVPVFATQKDYYTERAKATTVLRMVGCKQNEDKSYSILAERSISSSAGSINSHGMIYTTDASLVDKLTVEGKDEDESIRLLTAQRTSTVRTGLYEAKITGAESGVVYARPYIVLVKADGSTETVYGEVVTYNLPTSTQAAESDVLSTDSYDLSDISAEEPITPTEPTEKNPLEKIADFFAKLVEIIKTILSFFGLTGVAR